MASELLGELVFFAEDAAEPVFRVFRRGKELGAALRANQAQEYELRHRKVHLETAIGAGRPRHLADERGVRGVVIRVDTLRIGGPGALGSFFFVF
jgi:hypothetical protein